VALLPAGSCSWSSTNLLPAAASLTYQTQSCCVINPTRAHVPTNAQVLRGTSSLVPLLMLGQALDGIASSFLYQV
jgi:hypothetical protein